MGLSEDGSERAVEQKFQDLCADLNMDKNSGVEAWHSYYKINQNYTLEGEKLHWMACAFYVACRSTIVPTVDRSGSLVEGNCVSLTRLLQSCNLSLIQFFSKMKKWQDMANLPQSFRTRIDRIESNFAVSIAIFKKFEPIFMDIFKDPVKVTRASRGRKQRRSPCTAMELFSFCWTFYVYVKGNFPAISDDLVNSYHLLLSCVDLIFSNVLLTDRRDLLERTFKGLPDNFGQRDYKPPTTPPCIVQLLCKEYDGLILEAKGIKEHWWKPHIHKLFEKKILKGKVDTLSGLIDLVNFEFNSKSVNRAYEEHVLNVGDYDERIFLGDDASNEIGIPSKSGFSAGDLAERMQAKRNFQQYMDKAKSLTPLTPLTGRKFLKEKEISNVTPVSTATQSVSKLQALLSGRKTSPSDALMEIFNECSSNPMEFIVNHAKEMGETFCKSYEQPTGDHPGSLIDFAKKRLQLGESLYYKVLENIMIAEKKRVPNKFDFKGVLEETIFHKSLFACCLEVVIFSYNSQRTFPWIIDVFNIEPYDFYKVIEIFIRAEDGLSRDVVKHLNMIEEQILETLAWKSDSPLWEALKKSELPIPSCEEVSLPSQMEMTFVSTVTPVSSPIPHPAVKRLVGDRTVIRNADQSPSAPSAVDCFQSPVPGTTTSAKRRLFVTAPIPSAESSTTVLSPVKNMTLAVQTLPISNAVTYMVSSIPLSAPATTSTVTVSAASIQPQVAETKPVVPNKSKRTGSIALFFRKFYHLASVRLRDMLGRLEIQDEDLKRKMWTCFEQSTIGHSDLMMDRHLDQLIMCAVYVMAKVSNKDVTFQEIWRCYRLQPQYDNHVYRSVLLRTKTRHLSGSSDESKNDTSCSNSPAAVDREDDKEKEENKDQLMGIRSSSTLPVPTPNSQPPTPTQDPGPSTSYDSEDRGNLVEFYNTIYVAKMQAFVLKFSTANKTNNLESPPLSPLPLLKANTMSPRRRLSTNHSVYVSPMKRSAAFLLSPGRPFSYSLGSSPAKDLRDINKMLRQGERKVGKRILQDDNETDNPSKRLCPDLTLRKIQNVITERQGANLPCD